jgi:hypothetical protein
MSKNPNPSQSRGNEPTTTTTATATKETATEKRDQNFDKLSAKLAEKRISLLEFAAVKEERRKRMLKDDYEDIKKEGNWLYDERIEYPPEILQKERDAEKARIEEASKVK